MDLQDVTEDAKRLMRIIINSNFPVRSASDGSIGLRTVDLVPVAAGRGGRYDNLLCHVEGQVKYDSSPMAAFVLFTRYTSQQR